MCPAAARSWPHTAPPPPPRRRPFLLRLAIVPSSVVVSVAAPSFSVAPSFPSPPRQRQQPRLSVPAHEGADNDGSLSLNPLMHGAGELEQGAGEPLRLPSGRAPYMSSPSALQLLLSVQWCGAPTTRTRGGANTDVAHVLDRVAFGGRWTRTGHPLHFTIPRCGGLVR